LWAGLLVGIAFREIAKTNRNDSIAPCERSHKLIRVLSAALQLANSPPMQRFVFVFASIVLLAALARAQGPAPSPLISLPSPPPAKVPAATPETTPAPALTKADLETFLDGLIPSQLQNRNIAGAVVSAVKDGQLLFQK